MQLGRVLGWVSQRCWPSMEHEPSIASRAHTRTNHPSVLALHGDTPLSPPTPGEARSHPTPPAPAGSPGNGMRGHPPGTSGVGAAGGEHPPGTAESRDIPTGTGGSRGSCPPAGSGPVPAAPGSGRGGAPEAAAPARRPPRRRSRLTSAMSSSPVAPAGRGAPAPPRRLPLTWGSRRGRGLRALRGARTTAASGPRARRGPPRVTARAVIAPRRAPPRAAAPPGGLRDPRHRSAVIPPPRPHTGQGAELAEPRADAG